MNALSTIGLAAVVVAGIGGAAWIATENSYRLSEHYAPRIENVRRSTFEQSRAFQEGTIRDLDNLRLEYGRAGSDAQRQTIADTARHRLADVPVEQLPPSLQAFARDVETAR